MKAILASVFVVSALAGPAFAGEHCVLDDGVVFSCTFNNGQKMVEVCDKLETDEADAAYAFLRLAKRLN